MSCAELNVAPPPLVGRDVVLNVPDHFGGIGVRAVEADAAHEERK